MNIASYLNRIKELEEEIRQLKKQHLEELQEISVLYTAAVNRAERLEKELHALNLQLNAERERRELKKKRPVREDNTWMYFIGILTLIILSALLNHFWKFSL